MSNTVIAYIRTYVPMGVGWVAAYASLRWGFEVDAETTLALGTGLGGLIAAAYYFIINLLARRWPWFQWLLGFPTTPEYN